MKHNWTEAEKRFIIKNSPYLKDEELVAALARLIGKHVSLESLRKFRQREGIKKRPGNGVCEVSNPEAIQQID